MAIPQCKCCPRIFEVLQEIRSFLPCRYELSKVIRELEALNADTIALQEVDIACERSNNVDTGI